MIALYPSSFLWHRLISISLRHGDQLQIVAATESREDDAPQVYRSIEDCVSVLPSRHCEEYSIIPFSDVSFVPLVEKARKALGPSRSDPFPRFSHDKYVQHKLWELNGLRTPRTTTLEDYIAHAPFDFPVVVKPRTGYSSAGVQVAHDEQSLRSHASLASRLSKVLHIDGETGSVMVQELIEGEEFAVDQIWYNGKPICAGITRHIHRVPGSCKDDIYLTDTELPVETAEMIQSNSTNAVSVIGDFTGASHTELIVDKAGVPYLIELSLRPGGAGLLLEHLLGPAVGSDLLDLYYRVATGRFQPESVPSQTHSGYLIPCGMRYQYVYQHSGNGRLRSIEGLDCVDSIPNVDVSLRLVNDGDFLSPGARNWRPTLRFYGSGTSVRDVIETADRIDNCLEFIWEP